MGDPHCGTALSGSSLGDPICVCCLGEIPCGTLLGNPYWEPSCGTPLGTSFRDHLWDLFRETLLVEITF